MSAIDVRDSTHWETWTEMIPDTPGLRRVEELQSTGTPAERSSASIVDDFADDLRRLADA